MKTCPAAVKKAGWEDRLMAAIAIKYGVTIDGLKGPSRERRFVQAREDVVYFLRRYMPMSLEAVGKLLGGRSPATISHLFQQAAEERSSHV